MGRKDWQYRPLVTIQTVCSGANDNVVGIVEIFFGPCTHLAPHM